jgi:hypothetical protein
MIPLVVKVPPELFSSEKPLSPIVEATAELAAKSEPPTASEAREVWLEVKL